MVSRKTKLVFKAFERFSAQLTAKIANDMTENVIAPPPEGTPVDTEFHRSNWVPKIGTPFTGVVGSDKAVSFSRQEAGLMSLGRYRISQGPIYVSNSARAIVLLANGSSSQSPSGWPVSAVAKAVRENRRARGR